MRNDLSIWLESLIAFLHPVIMSVVILGTFYAAYCGIQTRRTRSVEKEKKKEMVQAKYGKKHFQIASILLTVWVWGSLLGMAATYYLYSKLFLSPHLIGGLGIIAIAAIAGALVPWLQRGKKWARTLHITLAFFACMLLDFSGSYRV